MIFLPIKPKYALAIKDRKKKVEFRKVPFRNIKKKYCIVYASSPYKKVVGYFRFKKIEEGTPRAIWNKYKEVGVIEKDNFDRYFKNKDRAYAIEINKFFPVREINPLEKIEGFKIPQSFSYLSLEEVQLILQD